MHWLGKTEALGRFVGIGVGVGVGTPETVIGITLPNMLLLLDESPPQSAEELATQTFTAHVPGLLLPSEPANRLSGTVMLSPVPAYCCLGARKFEYRFGVVFRG